MNKMKNSGTIRFKTNIKCGGCISQVSPSLNEADGISKWEVDTAHQDKILTVHSDGISVGEITKMVRKSGFSAEFIKQEN
jgi:copper chaperone